MHRPPAHPWSGTRECSGRAKSERAEDSHSTRATSPRGFTLLELLLAITLMATVMAITFMVFSVATNSWKRGTALVDSIHHGDFVIDQLAMALRSAYFPIEGDNEGDFGFWLEDNGSGSRSADVVSWAKLGSSLVGKDVPFVDSPHRVVFTVDDDDKGRPTATIKAWRIQGHAEEFDPEVDVEPVYLSRRIVGFNCRPADPDMDPDESEIDWMDDWEFSNTIPKLVEVTIYLEPLEEGEDPIEVKRVVDIPVAYSLPDSSWTGSKGTKDEDKTEGTEPSEQQGNQPAEPSSPPGSILLPPNAPPQLPPS